MVNLVQKPNEWLVSHVVNTELVHAQFTTIELASEFMMGKLRVDDLEIDDALCALYTYSHVRAIFNNQGKFVHSQED